MDRRRFLHRNGLGLVGLWSASILDRAGMPPRSASQIKNPVIVFQGDSITDAHRDKARYYANDARGMGNGYVMLTAAELLGTEAAQDVKIYNRGISGHKVFQLANRWDIDCLSLKPTVLSILIGVNDFWHTLDWNYDGTAKVYERDLRALLQRTKEELPDVKLIMGMPFAVKGGTAITSKWDAFTAYQDACQEIALDFNAAIVPYQRIFDEALDEAPVSYWCPDGVHPSMAGAYLMKEAWMRAYSTL
ncbi:MAG: SGNH/GDSL hydrolase family protein [Saprospiraceae bacterium]|nr:SGNH/GDSL hydrolase family protein [Saprospiraceae bacterium]